jgi:hypothetical protein
MKSPCAYEHMAPETVGNRRRVLVSDLSGKSNVTYKARELGLELGATAFDSRKSSTRSSDLEQEGYQFDVADGSFKILLEKFTEQFTPLFELESFRVTIEKDKDRPCSAHATIKIRVGGQAEITAAEGNGPVSALDNALRKALDKSLPRPGPHASGGLQGAGHRRPRRHRRRVRVFIESRDQDRISGAPSGSPRTSSRPAGMRWPTASSTSWPRRPSTPTPSGKRGERRFAARPNPPAPPRQTARTQVNLKGQPPQDRNPRPAAHAPVMKLF